MLYEYSNILIKTILIIKIKRPSPSPTHPSMYQAQDILNSI